MKNAAETLGVEVGQGGLDAVVRMACDMLGRARNLLK